jgi:hypothetical protein
LFDYNKQEFLLKIFFTSLLYILIFHISATAQVNGSTAEDSLSVNSPSQNATTIGGYGNAFYQRDFNNQTSIADLERVVLSVGHTFGDISFFSELEMEDAKVTGGVAGGEIAFEQAYLKFNLDPDNYITAGLFLPRIGILNENHLPNSFNGNERTQVETYIIPSTWRELGIGFFGSAAGVPLSYSFAVVNGLNSASFQHGSGIREGRFEGRNATANNIALTGSLQFYSNNFKFQASGYYGGTVGLKPQQADSLKLNAGLFGTPVIIGEADIQYKKNGFSMRILGTAVSIPDAFDINRAYANNTPKTEYGAYTEIGYDILKSLPIEGEKQLIAFVRYEKLDMNAQVPGNGIIDGTLNQQHIILGLNYLPIKNVTIKGDIRMVHSGNQNPILISGPYKRDNVLLNLGLGFSF